MLNPIVGKLQGRQRGNHRAESMAFGARFAAATRETLTAACRSSSVIVVDMPTLRTIWQSITNHIESQHGTLNHVP